MATNNLIRLLSIAHWIGAAMLATGIYTLMSSAEPSVGAMTGISVLIGLGLVLMAPYPVVLFIRWSQRQQ